MALEVGDRVGDYEIVQVLGAGGMGKVYKVRNALSDRFEAMKVLLPNLESDPALADRFLREIKVQATLDHPNIAGLHTALRVDNQLLMFIEFVEGMSLDSILRQYGRVPVNKAADFICQVLDALSYAHERGVIHRDIKPANMMLTPQGVVKLMDFGIAKSADRSLTQTGRTVGSLYYMSPEQINGSQAIDGRADLYSLGISLYELVTGKRPFEGDSDYSIMAGHLHQPPVPPIEIDPAVPKAINDVILMAIGKDPAKRFQSAAAFRNALATAVQVEQNVTAPAAVAPEVVKKSGNSRSLYMLVGSVATLVVLGLVVTQAPRFFRTKADQALPSVQAPATPLVEEPGQAPPEPTATPATSAAQSSPPPLRERPTSPPPVVQRAQVQVVQQTPTVPPPQASVAPPVSPPAAASTESAPDAAPPPAAEANRSALRQLRERSMMLATRIGSLKPSLDTLRREQAAAGITLRGDITQAWQRIEFFMDEADESLKAGDPDGLKKNLDQAERQVEIVEKFLGR